MLGKLNHFLNIVIGVVIGTFFGHGVYVIWERNMHPELYAMQSAPWYTSILVYGIFTIIVLVVAVVIKLIVRWLLMGKKD